MARLSVVHIAWSLRIGGIETMLVNLANAQARRGVAVKVVIINNQVDEELAARISDAVKVVRLNRQQKSRSPWSIVRLNCELFGADVIHSHSFTIASYVLPHFRKKMLLTIHTTDKVASLTQSLLRKYRTITAISSGVQQMLKSDFDIDSTIIYNGIDCSKIVRREGVSVSKPLKAVQVGRLIRLKGHHILIDAIAQLPKGSITLDVIGDGEERSNIEKQIEQRGLGDCVRLLGRQSQEYLFNHLADYDLLVQPSIVEGFGLTVAEAMTAAVPVMVSDISGLREVVDCGAYGRLFRAEDSQACAEALERFIANPPTDDDVQKAEEYARKNFDICSVADSYINLYKAICR